MMEQGHVTGLELDKGALENARRPAHEMGLDQVVEFLPAEKQHIPMLDSIFDGLVSEFIVYPTTTPTEIGQPEMARVLTPGGKMILTDVVVTKSLPQQVRQELATIGQDYLYEGTPDSFRSWMVDAGLFYVEVRDLTPIGQKIWEDRYAADLAATHAAGYSYFLADPPIG